MIFYSNSIQNLLDSKTGYLDSVDQLFKEIQDIIKYEVVCLYRNALRAYSHEWKSLYEIDEIEFLEHRLARSLNHYMQSIVIARYLQKWIEEIQYVIENLERKFI